MKLRSIIPLSLLLVVMTALAVEQTHQRMLIASIHLPDDPPPVNRKSLLRYIWGDKPDDQKWNDFCDSNWSIATNTAGESWAIYSVAQAQTWDWTSGDRWETTTNKAARAGAVVAVFETTQGITPYLQDRGLTYAGRHTWE
jgi:hypothetical protein